MSECVCVSVSVRERERERVGWTEEHKESKTEQETNKLNKKSSQAGYSTAYKLSDMTDGTLYDMLESRSV